MVALAAHSCTVYLQPCFTDRAECVSVSEQLGGGGRHLSRCERMDCSLEVLARGLHSPSTVASFKVRLSADDSQAPVSNDADARAQRVSLHSRLSAEVSE